jgi:two-component system nitrogen regulation response regulator GlnG
VQTGHFRLDLFHRLNEFTISLPSLRDRREDILFLADRFRRESNAELHKTAQGFSKAAQVYLLTYDWPGNVRELRHAVRRAVLFDTPTIDKFHLQQSMVEWTPLSPPATPKRHAKSRPRGYALHDILQEVTVQLEKALIESVLQEVQGNKRAAAKRLQIGYKTLYRRLKEYNLG